MIVNQTHGFSQEQSDIDKREKVLVSQRFRPRKGVNLKMVHST